MTTYAIVILLLALLGAISAAIYYSRKATEHQDRPAPTAYIEGLKAILRGQDEAAFNHLKEAVRIDTDNIDAYIRLGNVLRQMKKTETALQIHRDLTYRHNLNNAMKIEILMSLYADFREMGDEASALKAAKEILSIEPKEKAALKIVLRHLESEGQWKDAAEVRRNLDRAIGQDSSAMLAFYKVFEGKELVAKGELHRARLFFKEAIHINKYCIPAYIEIGDSYYSEERLEDALDYWTKVISHKPEQGHLVFERMKKGFFEVGRYGEYADAMTSLLERYPEHLTARLELAYFMEKKGDTDGAREHYNAALDHHPESLLARLGQYRLYRGENRDEAAANAFKQVLKQAVKYEATNFKCQECGLESDKMRWLCPRCKAIDSFDTARV